DARRHRPRRLAGGRPLRRGAAAGDRVSRAALRARAARDPSARGAPSSAPSAPPMAVGIGLLASVASTVAHSGGVVLGLYLVGRPLGSAGVVATGTLAYAISDVAKVGTYTAIGWGSGSLPLPTLARGALVSRA